MTRRLRIVIIAVVLGCLAVGAWSAWGRSSGPAGAKYEPADGDVYLGVSTDIGRLDAFDTAAGLGAGLHPAVYDQWTTPDGDMQPILASAKTRSGMAPMVSWNLPMTGNQITDGKQDSYIRAQVAAVKAYGKPVFIRLDWEMNATWYPDWNSPAVSPADFVAGWQYVYRLFQQEGAGNAAFVWSPTLWNGPDNLSPSAWYPGDAYVDWLGVDAYPQSANENFIMTGPGGLNDTAAFAVKHGKPLMIAEWAPALPQPDTTAAMDLIFDFAAAHPKTVKALVYFDFDTNGKDYTLKDHPVGAADFRKRVDGNSHFLLTLK
ncbi:MAG TPA: glycosyl hydrolase [Actinospica sp.]|nr:glycosyl hydrolase [Actinospica sp.]